MVQNCAPHLREVLRILRPTLVISQGAADRLSEAGLCKEPYETGLGAIEEISLDGSSTLLLKFTHPAARGDKCWGNKPKDEYLVQTVKPTVGEAMRRLLAQ